jgi:hypothetical protein
MAQQQRTHCTHPWDEKNTYVSPKGQRYCRRCHADRVAYLYPSKLTQRTQEWRERVQGKIFNLRHKQAASAPGGTGWAIYQHSIGELEDLLR